MPTGVEGLRAAWSRPWCPARAADRATSGTAAEPRASRAVVASHRLRLRVLVVVGAQPPAEGPRRAGAALGGARPGHPGVAGRRSRPGPRLAVGRGGAQRHPRRLVAAVRPRDHRQDGRAPARNGDSCHREPPGSPLRAAARRGVAAGRHGVHRLRPGRTERPGGGGGEVRPASADRAGRLVLPLCALLAYDLLLRPRMRTWGSTPDEHVMTLPGDEVLAAVMTHCTKGLTID